MFGIAAFFVGVRTGNMFDENESGLASGTGVAGLAGAHSPFEFRRTTRFGFCANASLSSGDTRIQVEIWAAFLLQLAVSMS
jgi:hypothetical protein